MSVRVLTVGGQLHSGKPLGRFEKVKSWSPSFLSGAKSLDLGTTVVKRVNMDSDVFWKSKRQK